MASETQVPELSSAFERFLRHRDLSLFLPFILGFTSTTTNTNTENPDQENQETTSRHERIILINPFTQGMVVIEGTESLDSLLRELAAKNGHPPASRASIESLPSVDVQEIGDRDSECAICLEEWEIGAGAVVKEMPCKHRFHGNCIEKWLGIHGSCPVCRYKMPVDDEELSKKRDHEEEGEGGRERRREIWVSFSFNSSSSNRRNDDSNQTPSSESNDVDDNSTPSPDQEREG
ncbi:E3 ubiquitin-protein ligase MPSR1 [Ricinus communis]|uniref:RING-type E3 ubiquitin transferase n=1 Tax=Ricinus communis TaxID=3988 RepID=B9S8X8_RICCO|nr:E3 ubiquitin-protein ligase MPSR1 [Ricinus communis]EEF39939.1 zinc finger protein, putative [Ricinus communis]|eukprot:XP_025013733.1 E3 ubiquitin-protein ligase MPSR1 [Ricinus communis]